jgi:hypothetical protein
MLMRPDRGRRLPRHVFYLALLLAPLLGLSLLTIGDSVTAAAWGQDAPPTTSPDSTDPTTPETTASTSTETSTTEPCATTTTDTSTTQPCATTTTATAGELVQQASTDLQTVTPQVVVDAAAAAGTTVQNATSILTTTSNAPTQVAVANKPAGDVKVTGAGTAIDIGLPPTQEATPARVGGNLAVFAPPDQDRAAVAVQPRDTGARVMVIIRSAADPEDFRFPVKVPAGGRLVPMAGDNAGTDGTSEQNTKGYVILDREGEGVGSIAAPWALDAAGQLVSTWYKLAPDGTIVQHVDHAGTSAHYPVVADPLVSVGCAWTDCALWFSASVTSTLARYSFLGEVGFAVSAEVLCLGLVNPIAKLVCGELVGAFSQALIGTLRQARDQGACLRVSFTPLVSLSNPSPMRFAADSSSACSRGADLGRRVAGIPPGSQAFVNNRGVTFTVVGGALFWIPNSDQLGLLTGDPGNPWGPVRQISSNRVRRYRDLPADGTLFQEVSNSQAYYMSAGHCWSITAAQFVRHGFEANAIKKVPDNGRLQCPFAGPLPA